MSVEGALLFARYAYPPNALGYCGPSDAGAMLMPDAAADIERRARQFDGAWCYLEFLASSAGLSDPLDERVVEAYWVGNDLLDGVDSAALVTHLVERFHGQAGGTWRDASTRATAHHSFQVFEVYPWLGLLGATGNPTALSVLDRCRIRTGTVVSVRGEVATVTSRPLSWDGTEPVVGEPRQEKVRWSVDGMALIGTLSPGDPVALHWDWVCDVLTGDRAARIEAREAAQLAALGRAVRAG